MAYTIYSFGGGETLKYIFNGLAMVLSFSEQGLASSLIRLVGIVSVIWVLSHCHGQAIHFTCPSLVYLVFMCHQCVINSQNLCLYL
jgi:hypothetical protein